MGPSEFECSALNPGHRSGRLLHRSIGIAVPRTKRRHSTTLRLRMLQLGKTIAPRFRAREVNRIDEECICDIKANSEQMNGG